MRRKKSTTESSNSLIKELSSVEFIKQPYLYAMVGADFSLYQRSIMIEIMKSMQDRFNEFLKNRRADGQMSLFPDDLDDNQILTFRISASSLGVSPRDYMYLSEACDNLMKMNCSFYRYDEVGRPIRTYAHLFSTIEMPMIPVSGSKEKERRMNYVEARMDVVAYPTLMPENMLTELRRQVEKSKNRPPKKRTTWFCCPSYYPSMLKPYYPQPAWWSIFPSMTYDYATTLITDKAMARQNATMWGKMIFINNEYLRAMFDEMGADTTEAKQAVRDSIYKKVNEFLQRRENNGKTICLDSFVGPDGKTMQHAVEIVDVPQLTNSRDLKEELSEISSVVFFAIGVHPSLIGSTPGNSGSTGGTYMRELQLLKQNQLSTRQRIYLRFLKNIYTFNKWDKHGEIVIRQQTFTTLDRSATGTEETESTL